MKSAILVFPGSNCDRDAQTALHHITGHAPHMVWHKESELPLGTDLVIVPGGFSFGDYLRSGAIAARSAILDALVRHAKAGGYVLGICNGFQILTETGLLPGALMQNALLKFVCKMQRLEIARNDTAFTSAYQGAERVDIPIAHMDGNYFADQDTLDMLEGEGRIVFRYKDNPNGSCNDIAGIMNAKGNVLGMMPHPERAVDPAHGGEGGTPLFHSLMKALS